MAPIRGHEDQHGADPTCSRRALGFRRRGYRRLGFTNHGRTVKQNKVRSFGTVQEAVDFIMSSERLEGWEVCVSLLPSGTEKRSPKPVSVADDGRADPPRAARRQI